MNVIPLCHEQVVAWFISLWRKYRSEGLVGNGFSAIVYELPLCVLLANLAAHLPEVSLYKPEKAIHR